MIPYNHKTDIALANLQTMVAAYEELKEYYRIKYNDTLERDHYYKDPAIIIAMETQNSVNKAMLDLFENILADNYPGATRYICRHGTGT